MEHNERAKGEKRDGEGYHARKEGLLEVILELKDE